MSNPQEKGGRLAVNEESGDKHSYCFDFPVSIYFIVVTEFCERFCYYGMRAVLVLYLTQYVGLADSHAMGVYHFWVVATYVTPLLGGYIADNHIGMYNTIMSLSIIYAIGTIIMATTAAAPPNLTGPVFGLLLIALGSGGIKSSTSSLGGDQFPPDNKVLLGRFFSIFYFTINAGALLSAFITPILRAHVHCNGKDSCYPLAFGVSSVLMVAAIIVFRLGKRMYIIRPHTDKAIGRFIGCYLYAFRMYLKGKKVDGQTTSWLDYARDQYCEETIFDVKTVNGIVVLFLPMTIFWTLYDQQSSRWTLQASHLDGYICKGFTLLPDQMSFVNAFLILAFIPLFESVIYPLVVRCGIPDKPLRRMTAGLLITVASFLVAFFLQLEVERHMVYPPASGHARVKLVSMQANCSLSATPWDVHTPASFRASPAYVLMSGPSSAKLRMKCDNGTDASLPVSFNLAERKDFLVFGWLHGGRLVVKEERSRLKKHKNGLGLLRVAYVDGRLPFQKLELRSGPSTKVEVALEAGNVSAGGLVVTPFVMAGRDEYSVRLIDKDKRSREIGGLEVLSGEVATLLPHGSGKTWSVSTVMEVPGNNISILWQLPQYVMITAAEILVSITGLAFSYAEAPPSMKASVSAVWLLYTGLGNLIVAIVSELNLMPRDSWNYILFSGLCFLTTIIFVILAYSYKKPVANGHMRLEKSDQFDDDIQTAKKD